ncbi:MAG: hypothetical protein C5B59_11740 [Bacteroidetes bacterium]|nr:MAG: hypothetical protein C5B59_11740 [Bacteroidota bacterium]
MNYRLILVCILALTVASTSAQINSSGAFDARPVHLFNQFPSITNCKISELEKVFSANENEILLRFMENHPWKAKIISRIRQNQAAETVNLSMVEFPKTILSISRVKGENGIQYRGLMWSDISEDAFVFSQLNNQYLLIKTEKRLVIAE